MVLFYYSFDIDRIFKGCSGFGFVDVLIAFLPAIFSIIMQSCRRLCRADNQMIGIPVADQIVSFFNSFFNSCKNNNCICLCVFTTIRQCIYIEYYLNKKNERNKEDGDQKISCFSFYATLRSVLSSFKIASVWPLKEPGHQMRKESFAPNGYGGDYG